MEKLINPWMIWGYHYFWKHPYIYNKEGLDSGWSRIFIYLAQNDSPTNDESFSFGGFFRSISRHSLKSWFALVWIADFWDWKERWFSTFNGTLDPPRRCCWNPRHSMKYSVTFISVGVGFLEYSRCFCNFCWFFISGVSWKKTSSKQIFWSNCCRRYSEGN